MAFTLTLGAGQLPVSLKPPWMHSDGHCNNYLCNISFYRMTNRFHIFPWCTYYSQTSNPMKNTKPNSNPVILLGQEQSLADRIPMTKVALGIFAKQVFCYERRRFIAFQYLLGASLLHKPYFGTFISTEMRYILCTQFGEIYSCSSLTVLPGPAWVLLNKICEE